MNYNYQSGATQLVSLMIEKLLMDSSSISFSEFFYLFLDKIGSEEALWSLDRKNEEKVFVVFIGMQKI